MEKNVEKLVDQIGFQFDEAIQLFSEETLEAMALSHVVGGAASSQSASPGCNCPCPGKDPTTPGGTTEPASSKPDDGTTPKCGCGCCD